MNGSKITGPCDAWLAESRVATTTLRNNVRYTAIVADDGKRIVIGTKKAGDGRFLVTVAPWSSPVAVCKEMAKGTIEINASSALGAVRKFAREHGVKDPGGLL